MAQALAHDADGGAHGIACHQLTPELTEHVAAVDLVIFVDAAVGIRPGGIPGGIVVTELEGAPPPSSGLVHHVDPRTLLVMAARLYDASPRAFLVTVQAGSLALGEKLSKPVAAALPEVVATIRQLIMAHRRG